MSGPGEDAFFRVLDAWDKVDIAAQRVLTALPSQMTDAAAALDAARIAMGRALREATTPAGRAALAKEDGQ